jgi:phage terminase large subunit
MAGRRGIRLVGRSKVASIVIPYKPRDVFQPFHDRKERWACIVAHRRAGKTVATINDLIRRAIVDGKEHGRYAYLAPFYSQAKAVAWDYLLRFSAPIRTWESHTELCIELINGARIRLYGADNPDALRGLYLDGVVMDEVADMRPRVWGEIIRPLLTDRMGWATFIGTPKGKNEFWRIWQQAKTEPNWVPVMLRASETGIVDAGELAEAAKQMSEDQYEQEFECSFEAALLGAYYGRELVALEKAGRIVPDLYDPSLPVYTAWDLGYRDDTAIWWFQVLRGEVRVIDFHASSGGSIEFYATVIKSRPYKYRGHWLPHDAKAKTLASGGRSIIEQLAEHLDFKTLAIVPDLSIQDGIQAARMMLPHTWFDAKTEPEGIEALRQYQREWDEDKKAFRERPRHDWTSHPADAFRMMAIAWREEVVTKQAPEPIRGITVGIPTVSLDEMWRTAPKQSRRI